MKEIAYTKAALKALRRAPANEARRILGKIRQYALDPASLANNVKALSAEDWPSRRRLRIGSPMQKIVTPKGETLVILPIEEYERLIDRLDIAEAKRISADIAAGRDELVPAEVVERLLNGENPVRVWRVHRNIPARELASIVGISAPYLSEIETGKKDGSISVMKKIAEALRVDLDDLA